MGSTNEAVFFLAFLPHEIKRFVVLRRDTHQKRNESLAEYYYRTYQHLLNGISIIEIDVDLGTLRKISVPKENLYAKKPIEL